VVLGTYRDLFAAIAGCAAALTGLLFVAMSVASGRDRASGSSVIQQVRAAASLLSFTNVLAVSLFSLVPHTNVGFPATVLAVVGIFFTAAGTRSIFTSPSTRHRRQRWRQLGLIILLLVLFGTELAGGIMLLVNPRSTTGIQLVGNILVGLVLVGVARAWELVGDRDTGIIASIAVLTGHELGPLGPPGVLAPRPPDSGGSAERPDG